MIKLQERLEELREMEDGWLEGKHKAPTEAALKSAEALVGGLHLVPMPDGGIQIEVHTLGFDFEVEVGPDGKVQNLWLSRG